MRQTPWVAALVVLAISTVLLPLGELDLVAGFSSFGSLLAFAAVNIALVVLRYGEPDRERPFKVPLSLGRLPVLPVLGALAIVPLLLQFDLAVYVLGIVAVVTGIGLSVGRRVWSK